MKKYRFTIITLIIITNLVVGMSALAAEQGWVSKIIGRDLITQDCAYGNQSVTTPTGGPIDQNGVCDLNDLFLIGVNISKIILGLLGTAALLMFVYGGVLFLISSGNTEQVQKGKSILKNAALGIVIVLSAWAIVNFILIALTAGRTGLGQNATLFPDDKPQRWDQPIQK